MDEFKKGQKDVLCATDVASKGLDFEGIQHVINYDMPEDIENYGEYNYKFLFLKENYYLGEFKNVDITKQRQLKCS